MTRVVSLSGGIGSGKSTVTKMLAELGAVTVDADAIVHELQAPNTPIVQAIAEEFGEEIVDAAGALDREALGAIVFRDDTARARLGQIVHPPVIAEMLRRAQVGVEAGAPLVVLDIPLFFEGKKAGTGSATARRYEAEIVVWVPRSVQIERTMKRDDCDRGEAERRVAAQLPIDEKRTMASHVIDNSGALEETRTQVEALFAELTRNGAASVATAKS
jgi:dephospho-CoA kinase